MKQKNVLVFKSATDYVMKNTFDCLNQSQENQIICLIQTSQIKRYQILYPKIDFMDCKGESFYKVAAEVMALLKQYNYSAVYIPMTGMKAYNFGNLMEIVRQLNYKKIIFFHSQEDKCEIKRMNKMISLFYRCVIIFIDKMQQRGK